MSELKCWFAGSRNPLEYSYVDIVFAHNYKEAKKVAWQCGTRVHEECDHEYIDLKLTRKKEHDSLADGCDAYVVTDDKTLHQCGWHTEDAAQCDSCGLYEFEGLLTICEYCNQCSECGCCCCDKDEANND